MAASAESKQIAHLKRSVRPASAVVGAELRAAGVDLVADFISAAEEAALLAVCDAAPWDASLSRRVQHYGFRFAYATKSCVPCAAPLPRAFVAVVRRVRPPWAVDDGGVQCTVNEYLPGQGIAPHVDTHAAFGDGIFSLTLGGGVAVRLQANRRHRERARVHELYATPRSLLALRGAARFVYTHGIVSRKGDLVDDDWVPRTRRVSLTFRHVPPAGPCGCGFPASCDARGGFAPPLLPTRLRPAPGALEAAAPADETVR